MIVPLKPLLAIPSLGLLLAAAGCQPAPTADAEPFYVGRWAATESLCATGAWVFTRDELTTAGEVSCRFDRVTPTAAGYEIEATCIAQAPPVPATIRLSYAQSAQALLVEGGPFSPIGLVACPD